MLQRPKHRKAEIRTQLTQLNSVLQAPQKQCAPSLQKRRSGRPNLDVKRLHVFSSFGAHLNVFIRSESYMDCK